jgi:hypothetical protein
MFVSGAETFTAGLIGEAGFVRDILKAKVHCQLFSHRGNMLHLRRSGSKVVRIALLVRARP